MAWSPLPAAALALAALSGLALAPLVSGAAHGAGKTALLIIDVQDCFLDKDTTSGDPGSLPVTNASRIIPVLNSIRAEKSCLFDVVVRSQDYHPEGHISFGPTHGLDPFSHLAGKGGLPLMCLNPDSGKTKDAFCCPGYTIDPTAYDCETQLCPTMQGASDESNEACTVCKDTPEECFGMEQAMWTNHCLQSGDTTFPPTLTSEADDIIVQKGGNLYVDAYSAFMDNTKTLKTELDDMLKEKGVKKIYLAGIATDVCVLWSNMDALALGYEVHLITDGSAGLSPEGESTAIASMAEAGATLVTAEDLLAMECPMDDHKDHDDHDKDHDHDHDHDDHDHAPTEAAAAPTEAAAAPTEAAPAPTAAAAPVDDSAASFMFQWSALALAMLAATLF